MWFVLICSQSARPKICLLRYRADIAPRLATGCCPLHSPDLSPDRLLLCWKPKSFVSSRQRATNIDWSYFLYLFSKEHYKYFFRLFFCKCLYFPPFLTLKKQNKMTEDKYKRVRVCILSFLENRLTARRYERANGNHSMSHMGHKLTLTFLLCED